LSAEAAGFAAVDGFGELGERLGWGGAFCGAEDRDYGVDGGEAMNLVAGEIEDGHDRELAHGAAIAGGEGFDGLVADAALDAGGEASEEEAGGEALDVPLKGALDGFVEVVDVEDEAAVERGVGAEVEDVGVAAELGGDAGVWMAGEVGGHDGHGTAEESEGRGGHAFMLDLDEARQATAFGFLEQVERVLRAGFVVEFAVGAAGDLLASTDAEGVALGVVEGCGHDWSDLRLQTERANPGRLPDDSGWSVHNGRSRRFEDY